MTKYDKAVADCLFTRRLAVVVAAAHKAHKAQVLVSRIRLTVGETARQSVRLQTEGKGFFNMASDVAAAYPEPKPLNLRFMLCNQKHRLTFMQKLEAYGG